MAQVILIHWLKEIDVILNFRALCEMFCFSCKNLKLYSLKFILSSFNVFTATKIVECHFSSKYVDVGCGHEP